jgi:hypothetical protein
MAGFGINEIEAFGSACRQRFSSVAKISLGSNALILTHSAERHYSVNSNSSYSGGPGFILSPEGGYPWGFKALINPSRQILGQ